jgi:hypothetical protein
MDYVRAGQVKRLGPDQTIVLSYRASCVRETITGGTIVIDTRQSEIKSGKVRRSGDKPCNVGRIGQLKGEEAGGRTFRGPPWRCSNRLAQKPEAIGALTLRKALPLMLSGWLTSALLRSQVF